MNTGSERLGAFLGRDNFSFPLLLVVPVLTLFAAAIGGYLYFNQQQIISALADDEFQRVSAISEKLNAELSHVQLEILELAGSLQQDMASGLVDDSRTDALMQMSGLTRRNPHYLFLSLLNSDGETLFSVNSGSHNFSIANLYPDAQHGVREKMLSVLEEQPLLSYFQLLSNSAGEPLPETPALVTVTSIGSGDTAEILVSAYNAEGFFSELAVSRRNAPGQLWLLNQQGYWLAGGGGMADWAFMFPDREQVRVSDRQPEIWQSIADGTEKSEQLAAGLVVHQRVCARLSCTNVLETPLADIESGWILASFVPAEQLGMASLLAGQPDRWFPMVSVLVVIGLIAAIGAWLLGRTMVALRRNEKRLRQANLLQDAFFEKNPEVMFVKNLDGTYYLANEMCRHLAGLENEDFEGKTQMDVFPEEASAAMEQQDMQVIQSEEAMEFHTQWRRGGTTTYYKTLRFPMFDDDNQLIAVGGIANDVTDQVISRHALLENEKLLRTFIESAPDAVLISDEQGQVTLVNRQAELIFSYDREEMLNLSLMDLVGGLNKERIREALESAKRSDGEVFREAMESTGHGNNNRHFPVEFSLAPVTTDEGALVICLLRDTSDKALMETQLRQSQKMEAVGKLTGGMAHDFNNLLGIIIGNLALALKQVGDNERLQKRLTTAMKAADRGAELTKRMLAIARRQPLQPKPVSINKVVEEMSLMLPQTLGSDIEMELQLTPDLPPILVDESGFEGMLLNLAINSRDAMPQGGKFSVRTYMKDSTELEQVLPHTRITSTRFVHIMVKDSGEGMSEEALNRAFEPFFTTKEKGKGTGLGLAMIYGFVKQSKGFIVMDSKQGKGTSVHIYLPARDGAGELLDERHHADKSDVLDGRGRTVLLVDDEVELLNIAETYLEELGFNVVVAASGREALRKAEQMPSLDLLLSDVVMPGGMNGVLLAREIRALFPGVPVLYASGFPSGVIEENSRVVLDAPLIHKPYTLNSLISAIGDLLD